MRIHAFESERPSPPFSYGLAVGRFEAREIDVGKITFRALGREPSELVEALEVTARSYRTIADRVGAPLPAAAYRRAHPVRENELQARGITYFRGALVLDALRRDWETTRFGQASGVT